MARLRNLTWCSLALGSALFACSSSDEPGAPGSGTEGGSSGASGALGSSGTSPVGGASGSTGGTSAGGSGGTPPGGSGGAGGSAGSPPASCAASTLRPGDSQASLTHDGQPRTYLVHVPASYTGTTAVPLVIDMHGLTSSGTAQKGLSGWVAKSDKEGFIVIHPNGLNNSWNGGALCCGTSQRTGVDDVGFMRAIVAKLQQEACIDPKRVYATGLSNGGAMSHRLACEAADLFAATAPVSMGNGTRPCQPSRPISVTMFRGTTDTLVSYNGGLFPSAQADFDQWKMLSGCSGTPSTVHGVCESYTNCGAGTEVTLCTINGGHVLYSAAAQQQAPVPDVVWEMFSRQRLP